MAAASSASESTALDRDTVFLVGVITPLVSWDMVSMKEIVFPLAVGSETAACLVLKSEAFLPESVRFPSESRPAKLPAVALETLSAFLPERPSTESMTSFTAFEVAATVSESESVADDSCTTPFCAVVPSCIVFFSTEIFPLESWVTAETAVSVVPDAATSAVARSTAVTSPPVVVTTDRPAVDPTLPSLDMLPWLCPKMAKSDALLPESVRFPLTSSPAKLPSVASDTLSALLDMAKPTAAPVTGSVELLPS